MSTYIRSFPQIGVGDIALVGGKGANLGEMTQAGLPIPPGFCITTDAYRAFIESTGIHAAIPELLAPIRIDDPEDVEIRTGKIRELFLQHPVPEEIAEEIVAANHHLSAEMATEPGNSVPVAVRSSATAEDLPSASFAGQQDTYLNIRGDAQLLEYVQRCWASLWTARAVTYRVNHDFDHDRVGLSVVVQAMIESAVSGILFTANPVSGNRGEMVVNASWGLGEAIVSGLVTPDTFTLSKEDGAVTSREIAAKDLAIEYRQEGGTVEISVSEERRNLPTLSDEQLGQLGALGRQIEAHYGAPMDIEWGYVRGRFYILQARAITTLSKTPALPATGEYNRTMFLDIFPDPVTPAFSSAVQPLFHTMVDFTLHTWGLRSPHDVPAVGVYYNQIYLHSEYVAEALQGFSPAFREQLLAQLVNPFGRHERGIKADLSPGSLKTMARMFRFMIDFPRQLPGIVGRFHQEMAEFNQLDIEPMSDREIFSRIRELVFGTLSRLINYDYLMIALIRLTYQMLGGWLHRYFGDESEEVRTKLVSGVTGNVTMETNTRLWDLAEIAKGLPAVRAELRAGTIDIRSRLEQTEEGRAFLVEFDRFLKEYGHREFRMDILYPTWGEDPTPVFGFLRSYLDLDPKASPHRQQERLAQQRQELARTVEARVKQDLVGRLVLWPIFHRILTETQAHTRERDTMHFEFTRVIPPFRRMLLELGRRWTVQHLIDEPEDIFFLTLDEIDELTLSPHPMMDKVKVRRAELERSRLRPAPWILRDGQEVVLARPDDGGERVDGQYRGIAGSPGVVTGSVRLIHGPEEFDKLEKGEIMVAPGTNPVWTPLFAVAGGLITEVGGILSHGAIVAREYGTPAVMAVADATKLFHDGQRVTVDGDKGIVYVEQGEPA